MAELKIFLVECGVYLLFGSRMDSPKCQCSPGNHSKLTAPVPAPVPLSIFRSNSKFDKNSGRSQRYFAHVTTVSLSWRVQNIVVIGLMDLKLERSEFSSNFEFDRNMLSGSGTRCHPICKSVTYAYNETVSKGSAQLSSVAETSINVL